MRPTSAPQEPFGADTLETQQHEHTTFGQEE
jgi:hypothetical protein